MQSTNNTISIQIPQEELDSAKGKLQEAYEIQTDIFQGLYPMGLLAIRSVLCGSQT